MQSFRPYPRPASGSTAASRAPSVPASSSCWASRTPILSTSCRNFRPSFIKAARPPLAVDAYELFLAEMNRQGLKDVRHGEFGADMQVSLVNEGPCTIVIDTDEWHKGEK